MTVRTAKRPRIWRYEITEVDGDVPVKVGDVIVCPWKPDRYWEVHNLKTLGDGDSYVGSWSAKVIEELSGEMLDKYWASKEARP